MFWKSPFIVKSVVVFEIDFEPVARLFEDIRIARRVVNANLVTIAPYPH